MNASVRIARLFALLMVCVCVGMASPRAQAPARPAPAPLDVMTYNIRLGTANDGEDHWTRRRDMLFELLREHQPDLIGLQEAFRFQIDEILAAVPGYGVVGVGRDDGRAGGETSAILFKTSRLHVAESGTFWFSDTPDTPGTRTWGNRYNRVSSWARFIDADGRGFYHYNLHLDHESQPSREKSVELLRSRIESRSRPDEPVVVSGDFNVGEDNPALHYLLGAPGAGSGAPRFLMDTFRALHPTATEVGTFTAFKFGETRGDKIDYVLVLPGTEVLSADIIRTSRNGRYPSDHFPVTARIMFPVK